MCTVLFCGTLLLSPARAVDPLPDVARLSVTKLPLKTAYSENTDSNAEYALDYTGFEMRVYFTGGGTADYVHDRDIYELEKWPVYFLDGQKEEPWGVGEHPVSVHFCGQTAVFSVTVESALVQAHSVSTLPKKLQYLKEQDGSLQTCWDDSAGEEQSYFCYEPDYSGLEVTLQLAEETVVYRYSEHGNSFFDCPVTFATNQQNQPWQPGLHEVTVTVLGHRDKFSLFVVEKQLLSIAVKQLPEKRFYTPDALLDLRGLVLELTYEDESTELYVYGEETAREVQAVPEGGSLRLGTNRVDISFRGCPTQFSVDCVDSQLASFPSGAVFGSLWVGDTIAFFCAGQPQELHIYAPESLETAELQVGNVVYQCLSFPQAGEYVVSVALCGSETGAPLSEQEYHFGVTERPAETAIDTVLPGQWKLGQRFPQTDAGPPVWALVSNLNYGFGCPQAELSPAEGFFRPLDASPHAEPPHVALPPTPEFVPDNRTQLAYGPGPVTAFAPGEAALELVWYDALRRQSRTLGSASITVETPVITWQAPRSIAVEDSCGVEALLTGTLCEDVSYLDYVGVYKQHTVVFRPEIEILQGKDLIERVPAGDAASLHIREQWIATGAGRLDFRVTFTQIETCGPCQQGNLCSFVAEASLEILPGVPVKPTPAPPGTPIQQMVGTDSVLLQKNAGCEYMREGGFWQAEPLFTGLVPNTPYRFRVRFAETDTHAASNPSPWLMVTTARVVLGGTVAIQGNPVFGETLHANLRALTPAGAAVDYYWQREGKTEGRESSYTVTKDDIGKTLTLRVIGKDGYDGDRRSAGVVPEKARQSAPPPPVRAGVGISSVVLEARLGEEYRLGNSPWQDSPAFNGLEAGTSYAFSARKKESETHSASLPGAALYVTTDYIALNGALSIIGTPRYGALLYADITALRPLAATLDYAWTRGGTVVGREAAYIVTQADIGENLVLTVSGTGSYRGNCSSGALPCMKAEQTIVPTVPAALEVETDRVSLQAGAGYEYRVNNAAWQKELVFPGLMPATAYRFSCRLAATATHEAGPPGPELQLSTKQLLVHVPSIKKGKVTDGDGEINARDVLALQRHILKIERLTGDKLEAGKVTGGSDITARDVLALQRHILKIELIQ